jgi:Na+-driven multidrug efflux pump
MTDTYRASGDATFGTILELSFMYAMVVPCVYVTGLLLHLPFFIVFACCYIDEPIRVVLMQRHLYSGKWIKPVTPEGMAQLPAFLQRRSRKTT